MLSMASNIRVTRKLSPEQFKKPFQYGWKREVVYGTTQDNNKSKNIEVNYISPAGNRLRTKSEIELNLQKDLDINMFTFTKKPLGFDEEIVRTALERGYRKSVNRNDFSILGELIPTNNTVENENVDNCSNSKRIYIEDDVNKIHLNRSYEKYALMDVEQLRQQLILKDNLIEDLQECLVRNEMEISRLQRQIKTKTDISNDELLNLIRILFPMLTANQIKIMTKQKRRVNWTCEEISIGFALSFFSRRGYEYLIYKLEYPLPAVRTLQY